MGLNSIIIPGLKSRGCHGGTTWKSLEAAMWWFDAVPVPYVPACNDLLKNEAACIHCMSNFIVVPVTFVTNEAMTGTLIK